MSTTQRAVRFTAVLAGATALLAIFAGSASAAQAIVYDNIPSPQPGNLPSLGYEATATSEFGGQVSLAGTERKKAKVTVGLSSWACQSGAWNTNNCSTSNNATFNHDVQVNVYKVGVANAPGRLIGSVTTTLEMPYRPSANFTHCTGVDAGKWYQKSTATCFNGKLFTRTLSLGDLQVPGNIIVSVNYNTTHYGYEPIGEAAPCFVGPGGCPYDALNVATAAGPTVGTTPLPDDAYVYGSNGVSYCDGGAGGLDVFRLDAGCWTGFQPAFEVRAS